MVWRRWEHFTKWGEALSTCLVIGSLGEGRWKSGGGDGMDVGRDDGLRGCFWRAGLKVWGGKGGWGSGVCTLWVERIFEVIDFPFGLEKYV